ncbi:DUF1835 domain-containing protein [Seonamhaeicola aphaedonensis]|uniref:DUF1835 domain-containing protein n=1 Tax=Seonamhaeicola aphaedonensis TaxID=1461338 RepID=A0A3D9HJ97_9FLAO|nr:DUF1835 domain-containing protein [Seonamhaeicola aphaedonensis]RED49351.1 hypothetical protein DFQ02_102123 [Seonamhaeicola aphaedonensis]
MKKNQLHITNGSALTNYLNDTGYSGDIITWHEMLCEGPTHVDLLSDDFLKTRAHFFSASYNIELDIEAFKSEISKLDNVDGYSEIVLWFEYDLFCHINLIAVISLIQQKRIKLPLFLVCSGRVSSSKNLKGLTELSTEELAVHYTHRIKLNNEDIELAKTLWQIYNGKDHNLFKPYIVKSSSFDYMSNCLKAHLKRFPNSKSGLSTLEKNILEIIDRNTIKSQHHLLGYALNYQGFYGFGDLQLNRIIKQLAIFYTEDKKGIKLNRKGHEALLGQHNFSTEINDQSFFGGVRKLDFQFNKQENKLVKTVINAH